MVSPNAQAASAWVRSERCLRFALLSVASKARLSQARSKRRAGVELGSRRPPGGVEEIDRHQVAVACVVSDQAEPLTDRWRVAAGYAHEQAMTCAAQRDIEELASFLLGVVEVDLRNVRENDHVELLALALVA